MGIDLCQGSGVIGRIETRDKRANAKLTADGLGIALSCPTADGEALVVHLEPARGVLTLRVREGDLRLSAPGCVRIEGGDVVIDAHRDLTQRAQSRMVMQTDGAQVVASGGNLSLRARAIAVAAKRSRATLEAWSLSTTELEVEAREARWRAGTWKLRAGWVREHAANVVREVEETLEQRATRIRVIASSMFQVLSGRTTMRSKDHTAIDGKRVLLG